MKKLKIISKQTSRELEDAVNAFVSEYAVSNSESMSFTQGVDKAGYPLLIAYISYIPLIDKERIGK